MCKLFCFLCIMALFLTACGPSQEEIERQQRIDDSLMEIERISIIEKANQIFEQANEQNEIIETDSIID